MEEKAILRSRYKRIRAEIGERKAEYSRLICKSCEELLEFCEAECVLLYCAKGSEADIQALFEFALENKKTVAFPRCIDRENMAFHSVKSLSELEVGSFGIKEPPSHAPLCHPVGERVICFVPALAYDLDGYRLGYGGGYFDRFLSDFSGTSVGVTFDACLTERLPRDEHDIKTDYIITESQVKRTVEN